MKKDLIISIEKQICQQYDIEAIYLFGSTLKQGLSDDIDLALLFKDKPSPEEYFNFTAMFSLYLLTKYGEEKKFDLSILNLASPLLKHEVITYGKPLYFRDIDKLAMFELRARQEYTDYVYRTRFYDEVLMEHIKEG